jgi:phage baseplate assembly protein V
MTAAEIAAAIVSLVQDSGTRQTVQVTVLADEPMDDVEVVQPYGFTAVPRPPGATGAPEAMILFMGDRSKGVVIAVDDRRYRLTGLAAGEVALYDDLGQKVHLTRTKIIIDAAVGNTIELGAGATEALVKGGALQTLYNAHTHSGVTVGGGVTGVPVVAMGAGQLSTISKVL